MKTRMDSPPTLGHAPVVVGVGGLTVGEHPLVEAIAEREAIPRPEPAFPS